MILNPGYKHYARQERGYSSFNEFYPFYLGAGDDG